MAYLVRIDEPEETPLIELTGRTMIGRADTCDVVLNNSWVSRQHAVLLPGDGSDTFAIEDLGSTHLTSINADRLSEHQPRKLSHGDHICLGGRVHFVFLDREDPETLQSVKSGLAPEGDEEGSSPEDSFGTLVTRQVDSFLASLGKESAEKTISGSISPELTQRVQELRSLYEVSRAISSELDLERALQLVLTHVMRASGADRGFVMLLEEDGSTLRTVAARNMETQLGELEKTTFSTSIAKRALELGSTIVSKDTSTDPDISSQSILDFQIRSAICAPLTVKGRSIGTLYVDARQNLKEYSDRDIEFFTALAHQSAIAIENARLMASLRTANEELSRKVLEMSALYEVSKSLSRVRDDLSQVLETILDKSLELLGAERGTIMIYEEESDELTARVIRGVEDSRSSGIRLRRGEGIAGTVVATGKSIISNEGWKDPNFKQLAERERDIRQILCVPLTVNQNTIGVINLVNKTSGEPFSDDDLRLVESLATHAAFTIENERLFNLSIYDGLTGVYVHRHFQLVLAKEIEKARRYGRPLSLLVLDVDHFKQFNDTYGHQVGDVVLAQLAGIIKHALRVPDIVARYGGEEFVVILPETTLDGARTFAERLRLLVENHVVQSRAGPLKVTISIGVASHGAEDTSTKEDLIKQADAALYRAKAEGRNRVTFHGNN